jgi:putative ABC transport system ATP-binding protein
VSSPLSRLFALLRPDRGDIGAVFVFSMLSGALFLGTPLAVQALVNNVAFGASTPSIAILAGLLALALVSAAGVLAVQTWIVEIIQRRIFIRLFADLTERLRRISWVVRDKHYNPELVNRFFDVVTIQKGSAQLLLAGIGTLLSIVVGLIVVAFYHPLLLLMGAAISVVALMIILVPLRAGSRSAIRESAAKYEAAAWLEEIATHPITFRTVGSGGLVRQRSLELASQYVSARKSHYRIVFSQIVGALALQALAGTAVLGLGGWLVVQGELTLGQLVAAELIVAVVLQGVAKMGKYAETYYDLIAAVDKVGKLTDLEVENDRTGAPLDSPKDRPASISIRRLPLRSPQNAPRTLSFDVAAGEMVAIMGPSGGGKSHVLETIYGLRPAPSGSVLYDGKSLLDLRLEDYRREVAFADGAGMLTASVHDNLTLGRDGIDLDDLNRVLDAVGVREELLALPEGLATQLTPTGSPLSTGQVGRILLARLLLMEPRLLLIDRVVDDLSVTDRAGVLATLASLGARCTIILVTNHESVGNLCDRKIDLAELEREQA